MPTTFSPTWNAILQFSLIKRLSTCARPVFVGLLLTCFPTMGFSAPRALLIGLDYSGSAHFAHLPGIDLDLDFMEQVASDLGITDVRRLWNQEATLDGIRQAIRDIGDGVGREDLTLIYYSGHGTRIPDRPGEDEIDGQDEALVPFDARFNADQTSIENALVDDELGELLSRIASDRLLLIVDACHSGTAARSLAVHAVPKAVVYGAPSKGAAERARGRGIGVSSALDQAAGAQVVGIMAAQDHEIANATRHGSVLTKALYETVDELVDRDGRPVTVEELFRRIERRVATQLDRLRRAQPQLSQHPSLFLGHGSEHLRGLRLPIATAESVVSRLNPPEDDALINQWTRIAEGARGNLEMIVPRESFRLHPDLTGTAKDCDAQYADHLLSVEVVAPYDGYLNVVNAGQGESEPVVLFPNEKSTQDNFVKKGQRVLLPPAGENWCVPAGSIPEGMNSQWVLLLAAFSRSELNFYRDGHGANQFRTLSEKSTRSFVVAGGKRRRSERDPVPVISVAATAHVLIKRR